MEGLSPAYFHLSVMLVSLFCQRGELPLYWSNDGDGHPQPVLAGMTAFERELMQRLNHAGVNVKKPIAADQLRQVERMLRTVESDAGRPPHLSMSQDFRSPSRQLVAYTLGAQRVCL